MPMSVHTFRTSELDKWYQYYDRLDVRGPYHSPDYLNLLENYFRYGDETAELFVYEHGDEFVYYPYLLRSIDTVPYAAETAINTNEYHDIVSSWYYGGPLSSMDGELDFDLKFREAFTDYCREAGIVAEFVRYDPNIRNDKRFQAMSSEFNRETVPVDLTRSKEELWDRFEKRNRNAIRQGQDSDLVVEPTREVAEFKDFHRIYSNAMEARDASEHYRFEIEFFLDLLSNSDRASLLVARDDETVVGGSMLVHDQEITHDYIRASNPDYWDQRVNNLLCYEALMYMRETGRKQFDFQGGRPGVFRFKKSFSPARREFHIGKEIHINNVYDQLTEAADAAGIETESSYFPAYREERSN